MTDFSDKSKSPQGKGNDEFNNYLVSLKTLISHGSKENYDSVTKKGERIDDIIAEKERIKNFGLRQDIDLRKETLRKLFLFLSIETAVIFLFSFFQAIHWPNGFHLDEWSFKLLVTVTISQISIMLLVAVKYLFPNKK